MKLLLRGAVASNQHFGRSAARRANGRSLARRIPLPLIANLIARAALAKELALELSAFIASPSRARPSSVCSAVNQSMTRGGIFSAARFVASECKSRQKQSRAAAAIDGQPLKQASLRANIANGNFIAKLKK